MGLLFTTQNLVLTGLTIPYHLNFEPVLNANFFLPRRWHRHNYPQHHIERHLYLRLVNTKTEKLCTF
jgi:hypothetical protein